MLVEIEVHTVPHFKGPVNGKKELWWLGYGSKFDIQTSLVKIGHLLHKSGHFDSQLLTTVPPETQNLKMHFLSSGDKLSQYKLQGDLKISVMAVYTHCDGC